MTTQLQQPPMSPADKIRQDAYRRMMEEKGSLSERHTSQSTRNRGAAEPLTYEQLMALSRAAVTEGDKTKARAFASKALEVKRSSNAVNYTSPLEASPELSEADKIRQEAWARKRAAEAEPDGFWGHMKNNVVGMGPIDSPGEKLASLLNMAGESATAGVVGDETAGLFDALMGRGSREERQQFYRDQETQMRQQHPNLSLGADIGGALIGPGKIGSSFINAGRGLGRVGRGAGVGAGYGLLHGGMEGAGGSEDLQDRTQGAALGAAAGAVGGGTLTALGQGFNAALQRIQGSSAAKSLAPSLEALRERGQRLYAEAEKVSSKVPGERLSKLASDVEAGMKSDGYHPDLHPRLGTVLRALKETGKSDRSLMELEQLRRVASNAGQSLQPDERRLAGTVIDKIDDAIDDLGKGSSPLTYARDVWSRMRRLQTLEDIVEDASNGKNFERDLQTKVRALLRNPRKMRGYSRVERDALKKLASGSGTVGAFQTLGQVLSPLGIPGLLTSGAAAATVGPAAVALPVTGLASKGIADAMVRGRLNAARNTIGLSPRQQGIAASLGAKLNPLGRPAAATGLMGPMLLD